MNTIPVRTLGFQLLAVVAIYSFAYAGEVLFMAGRFFGVFFDAFVILGFMVLFLSCLSYCLMLMAQGKHSRAKMLLMMILVLLSLNFMIVMPQVEQALASPTHIEASVGWLSGR